MVNKYELTKIIEKSAPPESAEPWDLSGWIIETPNQDVKKVMLCLTVTEDILNQAQAQSCDMIISHHPLFTVPLDFNRGIDIYCAHTNLDKALCGTTETLIKKLDFSVNRGIEHEFLRFCDCVMSFEKLLEILKSVSKNIRYTNPKNLHTVKRIAFCGGSGTEFWHDALEYGAEKFVMISTDKAVNPTNVMGASKRLAEIYVQSLGVAIAEGRMKGRTRFVTTRFGNVLGSNGSVIPRFMEQIRHGGPVTVTHPDITRFFMTIPEACRLVMEAAMISEGNEIMVFEMGESTRIADLAKRMIRLAGYVPDVDIEIKYTGLRPGEKLYEEVLSTEENTIPTAHRKIKIAKVRKYEYASIEPAFREFVRLSLIVDIHGTVRLMKTLVPEFVSNNSRFEELDRELEQEDLR